MKLTSVIFLFAFLGIHKAECHPKFGLFLQRLQQNIENRRDVLPFLLTNKVIDFLPLIPIQLQTLCVQYDDKIFSRRRDYFPVEALKSSIDEAFGFYKRKVQGNNEENLIDEIKKWDPIGFIIYLTQRTGTDSIQIFIESITKYHEVTAGRVRLYKMRTEPSYYDVLDNNAANQLNINLIDIRARNVITEEYENPQYIVFDQFVKLVREVTNRNMYDMHKGGSTKYPEHNPVTDNDVQILYDVPQSSRMSEGNPICVYYRGSTRQVEIYVYIFRTVYTPSTRIRTSIEELYPHNSGIIVKELKSYPCIAMHHEYFSMVYATTLLLGRDPLQTEIKINSVYGDVTLYIRKHLLNMLANRKLALFP